MLGLPFSARVATNYWDNNDATAGFGTASGTWAATTTGAITLSGASRSITVNKAFNIRLGILS